MYNNFYNGIISNYWMRLSRIWRILQIKEGVIHRGRRPRWVTPSKICRILHILQKPNSIIALLFIQNIYSFLNLRSFAISLFVFQLTKNNTTSSPGFLGQHFNNLLRSFQHRWFNMTKLLTSLVQWFSVGSTFDVIDSIWRRFFPNLVNSSWLWWIMRVVLTNQKRGNILNE